MKVAYVDSEVARGAAEDVKKKALEDLEAERARSRSLSDDVERLKGELLEKSGAVAQAGRVIEDLRVANTELARSNREIERANTRLVGENTALEESIKGMFPLSNFFFEVCLVFPKVSLYWLLQGSRTNSWPPKPRLATPRLSSRRRLL
jgi:hypothetical protein